MDKKPNHFSPLENPYILDALGLVFFFIFIGTAPPLASDPGVGWHLKTGQWILENWQVPKFDPFLWSTEGKEWICNQWLGDLIFWLVYKQGGWDALAIFCFALPMITMIAVQGRILLANRHAISLGKGNLTIFEKIFPFLILALAMLVAWVQWIVRPVIFSFVLFTLLFYRVWKINCLERERFYGRFLVFIIVLFAIWANLHSAFPLGLVLLASVAGAAFVEKDFRKALDFSVATVVALVATLLNPFGYNLHLNIISLLGDPFFMKLNSEWLSPSFSDLIFLPLALALGLLIYKPISKAPASLWLRIVAVVYSLLSLKSVRYSPFLGLILPSLLIRQSDRLKEDFVSMPAVLKGFAPNGTIIVSLSLFLATLFVDLPKSSLFASKLLEDKELWSTLSKECDSNGGRIYNHPDLGGAITFMLYPRCKAGLDDRNELNGVDAYKKFFNLVAMESEADINALPRLMLLECKSTVAVLASQGSLGMSLKRDFGNYCLIQR